MNIMSVQEIKRVNHNRLEYSYTIEGEWSKYFEPSNPMWAEYSQPVDQIPDSIAVLPLIGNVIVLASPNYVDGMTGAMKDLMDHLAYTWMSHRPNGEMFTKTAVVLVSSAGAGNRRVLSSMERQLRSWMVPKVHTIGLVSHAYSIGDLTEKKARYVDRRCFKVASSILSNRDKIPFSIRQRFLFSMFRGMQKGFTWNEVDRGWWERNRWLGDRKPWKR